jgi:signal transduction histidine kinase
VTDPAEREGSAHARAHAVAQLRWLAPGAGALAALSRPPAAGTWSAIRADPGAVFLIVRQPAASSFPSSQPLAALLDEPTLLEAALRHLDLPTAGFVDWNSPGVRPVYQAARTYARLARQLAESTGLCDSDHAWVCGLLAPLGWLALCAVDAEAVAACLADPALREDPAGTQRRLWGIDQASISRRLARRWGLPDWLASTIGNLGLPQSVAQSFGADPVLFPLTRLAVHRGRELGADLGLVDPGLAAEDAAVLGIRPDEVDRADHEQGDDPARAALFVDPFGQPLLRDLLAVAAENRRLRDGPMHRRLEREADDLYRVLDAQVREEGRRVRDGKLTALAEFAAGAGHEINNPLAVISGQAQYLLGHQADWFPGDAGGEAGKALKVIIAQTRRIHGILRDLMLFARPLPPRPAWTDLPTLLGEVAASLGELAGQRRVRIEVASRAERLPVYLDTEQVRTALNCLLRNAVEAAPAEGWARLRLVELAGADRVEVAVEDSGPGPDLGQRDSLFDPFYSGRPAGRGRGLGLPIAWRLAGEQGGDVRLDATRPPEPTRFVLTLPRFPVPSPASPLLDPGAVPSPFVTPLPDVTANGRHEAP